MTPPRYSPLAETASNVVAVPKSRTMTPLECGDGGGDAVGPDLEGILVQDGHAGLESGADDARFGREIGPADFLDGRRQRGDDAGDDGSGDLGGREACDPHQIEQDGAVFVARLVAVGLDLPALDELLAAEKADGDRRIPDVECQEHRVPPQDTRSSFRTASRATLPVPSRSTTSRPSPSSPR